MDNFTASDGNAGSVFVVYLIGQCVDGVDSFNCGCDPGFTGEMCQTNIDDCVGVGCSRNGECLDGVNSFTCECSPGYTGPLCDIQGLTNQ